ncbi:glycoside hydrolase family 125 protein [Bacteroides sp. L10-4]|uniref:glycoside hydrolase family 125 protein n=1 Tax=Bacteroides sp. L10-4 TaxID=2746063 RepID=UPI0020D249B7|nr:glycoside hydrolase family 125 protein [Bacteroides sp. L10-4]
MEERYYISEGYKGDVYQLKLYFNQLLFVRIRRLFQDNIFNQWIYSMNRRNFIRRVGLLGAGYALNKNLMFANSGVASTATSFSSFPTVRKPISERNFKSPAIEKAIATFKQKVKNEELGWLFGNCFPNTLDTTVFYSEKDGRPDTYVITGDIDAMWLRDSSAQVYPYLDFMSEDKNLQKLIIGVINKQTSFILKDPYANAFYDDDTKYTRWNSDHTEMKPGIHERKSLVSNKNGRVKKLIK